MQVRSQGCVRTLLLAASFLAAVAITVAGRPAPAAARAWVLGEHAGVADGATGADWVYRGDTVGPGEVSVGDRLEFVVRPAPGSSANPHFAGGSTTLSTTVKGQPCDEDIDEAASPTKCYAIATVFSDQPGERDRRVQS
jgi:hypothetical protein